jgi:hypothetical protein
MEILENPSIKYIGDIRGFKRDLKTLYGNYQDFKDNNNYMFKSLN